MKDYTANEAADSPAVGNTTVVIPTTKPDDEVVTLESIPDDVPVRTEREGHLLEARNRGVRAANTDFVIMMDDDIVFPEPWFQNLVGMLCKGRLVGLEDYEFRWILGRVHGYHVDDWAAVGGYDERLSKYMGDTDFSIKMADAGNELLTLDRDSVEHIPHERSITTFDRAWRGVYMALKHPRHAATLFRGLVLE